MRERNDGSPHGGTTALGKLYVTQNPDVRSTFWSGWIPSSLAIMKFIRRLHLTRRQEQALVYAANDRQILTDMILPELAKLKGDILFVGVREYTTDCPAMIEALGARCWTIDIDPAASSSGVAGRHIVGSILDLPALADDRKFSAIILTGLFGFGVYGYHRQMAAIRACVECLTPTGVLVLGWNDRRKHADVLIDALAYWLDFVPCGALPPRLWVTDGDYNFAFLRRRTPSTDFAAEQHH